MRLRGVCGTCYTRYMRSRRGRASVGSCRGTADGQPNTAKTSVWSSGCQATHRDFVTRAYTRHDSNKASAASKLYQTPHNLTQR